MSVEKPSLEEVIGLCETESERRKWFEGAATVLKGLKGIKREREQAERARDEAYQQRDAALAEIGTKRAKYEADIKAALADLARVTKEKADLAAAEKAKLADELARAVARRDAAISAADLAVAQRDAYREEADREAVGIKARMASLRAEEHAFRERLSAALKT